MQNFNFPDGAMLDKDLVNALMQAMRSHQAYMPKMSSLNINSPDESSDESEEEEEEYESNDDDESELSDDEMEPVSSEAKNFHSQLCPKCNKSGEKYEVSHKSPAIKTVRSSLSMMFNFFSVLSDHGFTFVCVDTANAFSPFSSEIKTPKCKLANVASSKIYSKIHELLIGDLKYTVVGGDSALFVHPNYGYVLPYQTKLLVLSKRPERTYQRMLKFMDATKTYKDIDFMNCVFTPESDCLEVDSEKYIKEIYPTLFDESAQQYIERGTDSPVSERNEFLDNPPDGKPVKLTEKYIQKLENAGKLKWPKSLVYDETFDAKKMKKALDVLNYITSYLRADCEYQVGVLNTFADQPNKLVYFEVVHLFAYLTSNSVNQVRDVLPKKSALEIDIALPFMELPGDDRISVRVHAQSIISFATNAWISKFERIDITDIGTVAERMRTAHSMLEDMMAQLPSIESLSIVGYHKKPKYKMIAFNSTFCMALQHKVLSDPESKKTVKLYNKVMEIIGRLKMKVVYGPFYKMGAHRHM